MSDIFATCDASQGGFDHTPDRRGFHNLTKEQRQEFWDQLHDVRPGFALLVSNFPETFLDEDANRELSEYVADRTRQRVNDPDVAEKLIPTDHGFGMQRLPLETEYFEAYNRDNIHLVDITQTPIECITETGLQTAAKHFELDVIIYATGFPNMIMVAGPQSVSGSTNYPRAIETGVEWVTRLIKHAVDNGNTRIEAQVEAERDWQKEVIQAQERMPFRQSKSWFTGY
ncbi:MAG: cation diffusion facilitator CzcD-associated flavoprotein CzcO, partial [Dinoroseobacter sp.]